MSSALAECNISGTVTNIPFLSALCRHEEFKIGIVDTGLIDRDLDKLITANDLTFTDWSIAAILAQNALDNDPLEGWELWTPMKRSVWLKALGEEREMLVTMIGPKTYTVTNSSKSIDITLEANSPNTLILVNGNRRHSIQYFKQNDTVTLFSDGEPKAIDIVKGYSLGEADESTGNEVLSPMPGIVKVLNVAPQSEVIAGDVLVIIEAMKMEHSLTASRDGTISDVLISVGQQVEAGEILLTLVAPDD
jgi:3-methylcrotonyl-CoA carboxylase alpha subunit